MTLLYPFFIYYRTHKGRSIAAIILAVQCQYHAIGWHLVLFVLKAVLHLNQPTIWFYYYEYCRV